jgi:hypothetical protein
MHSFGHSAAGLTAKSNAIHLLNVYYTLSLQMIWQAKRPRLEADPINV